MRFNLLGLLLLVICQVGEAAVKIEHWQTMQGAQVYFVHTPTLPMADIRVTFDAGSARDGKQFGLASLTASLLGDSSAKWTTDEIASRFESVGATFTNGVSEDMAWVSLRSLTEKALLDTALTTFKAVLTSPGFTASDFKREKNLTLAALKHREESPGSIASIAFHKAVFNDHPYAHPDDGVLETVSTLGIKDLKAFYQKYYVSANATVVVVGDLSRQQVEQITQTLLDGLPVGQKPAEIPAVIAPTQGSLQHIEFPSSQTHVLAGLPGTYRKDPDYFKLYVGNYILGGGSLVSRLADEVREKRGLAYSASSQFAPLYRQGPFILGLQTRNDQADKALEVMNSTLRDFIDQGPTEAELTAAKQNITGGFAMRIDTNNKLTEYVTMIGFYQQPLDYLETFADKIQAVSAADIKEAFQRRVHPELLQTVTVGGKSVTASGK
jgi:zinc protease